MKARSAVLVGMAFLCAYDVHRMVGTGYVDTCANSFLLGGILFLVRFGRSKRPVDFCIAAAGFGLASSVKVNMLATSIIMALPVIVLLLRSQWRSIKVYCLCSLVFATPVAPWLLFNYVSTGYPLGCTPLSIGPIHFGALPPNLAWFLDRPDLTPYRFGAEAHATFQALRPFGFSLLLALLGVPGILLGVGRRRCGHVLTFLLMASVALLYFSPSFSVVRLGLPWFNGRFLAPIIIISAAAGLPVLQRYRWGTLLIETVSVVSVIVGVWMFIQRYILGRPRVEIFFLALAVLAIALIYCAAYRRRLASSGQRVIAVALCVVAFVSVMYAFAQFKNSFRTRAYGQCTTMHGFQRYWVAGLRALGLEGRPVRIAFTYGPQQVSHGIFLAPFLGRDLNNHLLYVSPYKDGAVIPHHPDYLTKSQPSFEVWIDALRKAGATHVLCLRPPCEELRWMQDHPNLFLRLAGQTDDWGLFRIKGLNEGSRMEGEPSGGG